MKIYPTSILLSLVIFFSACGTGTSPLPEKSTEQYGRALQAFYVGLAALEVGNDQRAAEELEAASRLAAAEPAVWNNLGVLQMRQKNPEKALGSLEIARNLAPETALIHSNLAALAAQRGDYQKTVGHLNKTIELEPENVRAIYRLAEERERARDDAAALRLYRQILAVKPGNLAVRLEIARLSAKLGSRNTLQKMIGEIGRDEKNWTAEIREQFGLLKEAAAGEDIAPAARRVAFFRNVLLRDPRFRSSLAEVKPSDTVIGELLRKPLRLAVPDFTPAPPDLGLSFDKDSLSETVGVTPRKQFWMYLDGEKKTYLWSGEKGTLFGDNTELPVRLDERRHLVGFDYDYDYRNDLAIANEKGFRLFRQTDGGGFTEVTDRTQIPAEILADSYRGVWVLDVDNEGDLDLLLAPTGGAPLVLQNNADGTFEPKRPFAEIDAADDFAYADLDEDGASDAVFRQGSRVRFFANERGGLFEEKSLPPDTENTAALTVAEITGDGRLDLITAGQNGRVRSFTHKAEGAVGWEMTELFTVPEDFEVSLILTGDIDNNAANDIILAGPQETLIYLGGTNQKFEQLPRRISGRVRQILDVNDDGRLDLSGEDEKGRPTAFVSKPAKDYAWQIIKPKSAKTEGDQRINTFGVGGEIEVRSGLHAQKRIIDSPRVHFGLGGMNDVDVARIVWQNGYVQAEFDLKANQVVAAEQRLKGSCPHLFAWNGERFVHVKDAPPWSPALGLKINAQETFGILQTEEWFTIPGDLVKPTKDGFYDLRITAEYWESYYIDHYRLLVVDHPEDTEIFTDERFAVPPPPLEVFTSSRGRPFARVYDDRGRDVSEIVREKDGRYLASFARGRFQGVAKEHFIEIELPPDTPTDRKIWFIGEGWMYPTDASINVQLGQSSFAPPRSLSLEVLDKNGKWRVEKENLGFPAGKMKIVPLDLTGVFPPGGPKKFRLRTNMEIFWDKLEWAFGRSGKRNRITELAPEIADLRYRGFSVIEKPDDSSPEVPVYDKIMTTNQRWRDLEGYHTRFGDVRELLERVDDRFVLVNAGDEIVLKFKALPETPKGYRRDFVIIGNGWIKDGDLNSVFSKTVLPLPTQQHNDYTRRPTRLEDDPVYRANREDWIKYHTRYVAPDSFRNAVRKK